MIFEITRGLLEVENILRVIVGQVYLMNLKIFLEKIFIKIKQMQLNTLPKKKKKIKNQGINNYH